MQPESRRNQALDGWDYQRLFAPFHITWGEGDISPAFGSNQAYAISLQELHLGQLLAIWGHREVLVTFSSEHIQVEGAAEREPAWVVIVAGLKAETPAQAGSLLAPIPAGAGVVVQALIHARSGQVLLGRAVPVNLGQRI